MPKRWSPLQHAEVESPATVERFLTEIEIVCLRFGYSVSHEDEHGAFRIVPYDASITKWLHDAHLELPLETTPQ